MSRRRHRSPPRRCFTFATKSPSGGKTLDTTRTDPEQAAEAIAECLMRRGIIHAPN